MAKQTILWTVLPNGRETEGPMRGRLRVSIVASPRLTPQAPSEQTLAAFAQWLNWPQTLEQRKFALQLGAQTVDLEPTSKADPQLWARLLSANTPVAGFVFKDMSKVNLRSYAVRNVLGLARKHYGRMAVESTGEHPRLLPWQQASGDLKGMLGDLGTRTHKIHFGSTSVEMMLPGFDRFFDDRDERSLERQLRATVFGPDSKYVAPVAGIGVDETGKPTSGGSFRIRVLPPDWQNPAANGPDKALMSQWQSADEYTLYQAMRFYRREPPSDAQLAMRRPTLQNVPPPPKPPEIDFHRMLASYGEYPALLRRLGLVIDAVLPADSPIDAMLAQAATAQGQMGLVVAGGAGHDPAEDACPRTAWQADKARFTTRARTGDHERGMLRLRHADDRWGPDKRSPFDLYQCDPDGASLKTVDFLLSAQRLVGKSLQPDRRDGAVTYTTGDRQPVAALRSGGLGVSRHGRAGAVAQSAAAAALKNQAVESGAAAAKNIVLFTEDVMRGYRVDVQPQSADANPRWHSLCRRTGSYRVAGTQDAIDLPPDEGYVGGASTTSTASPPSSGVDPDDHYLHESLFRWTGWSLVAPRPGRTMRSREDPATGVQGESVEDVKDELGTGGTGVAATFSATKGSLPRLRYGMSYRLRARVVDLAGNSLAPEDRSFDGDDNRSEAAGYWRFEPVDPPAMVQRARVSEGESLERLVVRSNFDAAPAAYLQSADFAAAIALPASADFGYGPVSERHFVPPKASQQQCETHGAFDALWSNPADIKQAYAIAAREAGTLYDATASSQIELITPQALDGIATTPGLPPRLPSPDNPTGDRLAPGQYVIHREASVLTPYLPDPAAGGVAVRALRGHTLPGVSGPMVLGDGVEVVQTPQQELVLLVAHGKDWPDSQGFRLVLDEQPAALSSLPCQEDLVSSPPKWDAAARELRLFVPKGRIVRLRYASFVHKALLDTFGIAQWVADAGQRSQLLTAANLGCAWMVTPHRSLTLVHAVQQPLCEPELIKLQAQRDPGAQHAMLRASVNLHGPSTGKFEIEAAWHEWVDDPEKPGPQLVPSRGALGEILLHENHANTFTLDSAVAEQQHDAARPRAPGNRHDFGDTRFRWVEYRVRAVTRFREYLPPALYAQTDKVTRLGPPAAGQNLQVGADDDPGAPVLPIAGAGARTLVPATAPPDEPRVLYVLPTFRWQRSGDPRANPDVTRWGNGLRVWLDRPWFSSGNGELLGVVLLPDGQKFAAMPDRLQPLVTQWGLDPLWDTQLPKEQVRAADFPTRAIDEDVELREIAGQHAHVVGHRVHWHASRRLWYCDIELDPGRSYMPFVRLALVRYQPHALPGSKVSKVVLADFAQVLPRRRVRLTRAENTVTLALHGVMPAHGPMKWQLAEQPYADISMSFPGPNPETGRNRAELVLQLRDDAIDSDLAWSDAGVLAASIVPAPPAALRPASLFANVEHAIRRETAGAATVHDRLGQRVDLERVIELGGVTGAALAAGRAPIVGAAGAGDLTTPILFDPVVWQLSATLPSLAGKIARLALREYERFYTDRTVPEKVGTATRRRRVIEERLVFTTFFEL